ncbi:MAG TPA: hypothetical protein VHX86_17885 [Tepidisphaeraceae bacterium]|jgi:hypothetical protein|nr:hypothetical protein [Tepidisphaeraceae bacterium]
MRIWLAIVAAGLLAAGCSSTSDGSSEGIEPKSVPAAVQGAFYTEHPYAQMNHPKKDTDSDGSVSYEIPYTRPDGTKGNATYAQTGELQKDQ